MSDTQNEPTHDEAVAKLRSLIKGIDIAMLTTVDSTDGTLRSRPMSTNGDVEFDGDLWFFTRASSHKVEEIERSPQVNASFAQPDKQNYVSMSGNAALVLDRDKMKNSGHQHLKAWFPKGHRGPGHGAAESQRRKGEYWDSRQARCFMSYGILKATLTGKSPSGGENCQSRSLKFSACFSLCAALTPFCHYSFG
jgi:general stress protein 26